MTGQKECRKCGRMLDVSQFYADKRSADRLRYECKECGKKFNQEYFSTPTGKAIKSRSFKKWASNGRGYAFAKKFKASPAGKAMMERNKHKLAARSAVSVATRLKKMPRAKTLACKHCGNPAKEYHHHNGYDESHWLDVIPLCLTCHNEADTLQESLRRNAE